MYIIKIDSNINGARPALQLWQNNTIPEGYAACPDEFYEIFYSTTPAGFVEIEVVDETVVSMSVNQNALDIYLTSLEECNGIEEEPSQLDRIEAQVTYTAMMTDTLLEE